MKPLRYFEQFDRRGAWHMAFDEVLLQRVDAGLSDGFFRLYTWAPWCITLGSFQVAEEQLNVPKALAAGIDIVQRPTGGRAVYHAQELTYTLCAPKDIGPWAKSLGSTYDWIAEQLLAGLSQIGFNGALERGESPVLDNQATRHLAKPPCFSSASRAEIVWEGKKIVGSAQRRTRNAFLQHGSILLQDAHLDIVDYLDYTQAEREMHKTSLGEHSVSLGQIPGVDARLSSVKSAIQKSFTQALSLQNAELTQEEIKTVVERTQAGENQGGVWR